MQYLNLFDMKKVEILVGHISFIDHNVPGYQHAVVYEIGERITAPVDDAEEIGEASMDGIYQGYIIPELYKGDIVYK